MGRVDPAWCSPSFATGAGVRTGQCGIQAWEPQFGTGRIKIELGTAAGSRLRCQRNRGGPKGPRPDYQCCPTGVRSLGARRHIVANLGDQEASLNAAP